MFHKVSGHQIAAVFLSYGDSNILWYDIMICWLKIDMGRPSSLWDGSTLGLVDLGALRKWFEQTMRLKQVSSIPPWPLYQLLLPGLHPVWALNPDFPQQWSVTVVSWNEALWAQCFITAVETLRQTYVSLEHTTGPAGMCWRVLVLWWTIDRFQKWNHMLILCQSILYQPW